MNRLTGVCRLGAEGVAESRAPWRSRSVAAVRNHRGANAARGSVRPGSARCLQCSHVRSQGGASAGCSRSSSSLNVTSLAMSACACIIDFAWRGMLALAFSFSWRASLRF